MKWVALTVGVLICVGCGGAPVDEGEGYDSTTYNQAPVTEKDREPLSKAVGSTFKDRKVVIIRGKKRSEHKARALSKQPLSVLQALYAVSRRGNGSEADLLITVKGEGTWPVSVLKPKRGPLTVRVGDRLKRGKAMSVNAIQQKFKTGPLKGEGAGWGEASRESLGAALPLLPKRLRALLVGLPWVRAPRGKDPNRGGEHRLENCKEALYIFDRAMKGRNVQFIGTPDAPHPAGVMTILHELGHALHSRPGRLKFCEYEQRHRALAGEIDALNKKVSAYNAAARRRDKQQVDALGREVKQLKAKVAKQTKKVQQIGEEAKKTVSRGPVLSAYAKVLGKAKGPTQYGRTSLKESFAESFALYYADPEALGRALPKVLAWFKASGHIKALGRFGP